MTRYHELKAFLDSGMGSPADRGLAWADFNEECRRVQGIPFEAPTPPLPQPDNAQMERALQAKLDEAWERDHRY